MNIKISAFFLIVILLFASAASADFGEHDDKAVSVSMIQIVANPGQWHKKVVHVAGVLVLEFEGDALYLSEPDAKNRITKNAVWVNIDYGKFGIPEEEPKDLEKYKKAAERLFELRSLVGKYVYVEGVFNKDDKGHLGLFSGELNVTRIYAIQERRLRSLSKVAD